MTRYPLDKPKTAAAITALVLDGKTDQQVAMAISTPRRAISRQAITAFRQRHRATFDRASEVLQEKAEDVAIAGKIERLRLLQGMHDQITELIKKNGLVSKEVTRYGDTIVETERFNEGLVRQFRGILDDAAREMGERRPVVVNNDNRTFNLIEWLGTMGES